MLSTDYARARNEGLRRREGSILQNPLSPGDRSYFEDKLTQQQPNWITEDYSNAQWMLQQDDDLKAGRAPGTALAQARASRAGPAMLALSRSGNPSAGARVNPPSGPGGGGPGQLPDATAMNFALADPSTGYHKLALEDAVANQQAYARSIDLPSPDLDLFSGTAAARARATGDVLRDEMLRNATARGTAQSNEYLAPGQADARRQRLWDDEKRQQTLSPYSPQNITGTLAYQRELAKGQYGLAGDQAQAESRTNAAVANAIRGLIASGAIANTPEIQNALIQQGLGIVTGNNQGTPPAFGEPPPGYGPRPQGPPRPQQPVLPSSGFMPPPGGQPQGGAFNPAPNFNAQQLQPFPRAQLAEYARQYGMTEPMAEEYLRRFQGYQVQ